MKRDKEHANFQLYGNKGLNLYYNWLKKKTADNENYWFELLANMDEFSHYDILQIKHSAEDYTDTSTSFIEIKTRDVCLYRYEDCVVDSYKIFNLQKLSALTNNKSYLVAIYTGDNKLAMWEIDPDTQYSTISKEVQWHTADLSGIKKMKEMVSLPISEAKIYNL